MPNRLAGETSPDLKQHADNPVDWYPWSAEALERARRDDKPILLSVGYSACHWCHVMARESFADAQVAAVMNRLFVNVKVDREERPDLDQIYQTAHQMLAQRAGGWPLTMFLSPDGVPFFGGTYFPKEARYGLPGFAQLCERVALAWQDKRGEISAQNAEVLAALSRTLPAPVQSPGGLGEDAVAAVLESLRANHDARHGGFGGAPKFPHPTDLELCLRQGEARVALATLRKMCEGGIYDQLGGGFYRYSVDAQWSIPHFEKMLYDNGPLLALLADAWQISREPLLASCAAGTAGWLMREMQSDEGGYYSSLDADSEHEEGKFYIWQRAEVEALLHPQEYAAVSAHYGLDGPPNFENRSWHLRVAQPSSPQNAGLIERAKTKLLAERGRRMRPARDDKVLASWNALAIRGMARAGRVFRRPQWSSSARRALDFLRASMWRDGRLLATYKDGRAHLNAYLDDYAFLIAALLEVMQERFAPVDLAWAQALADVLLERFEDTQAGGFFFTASDHERLILRPKPAHDQATASGNAVAARALDRLAALTGEQRYADAAERTLALFHPAMRHSPAGFGAMALALSERLEAPRLLILRGEELSLAAWQADLQAECPLDVMLLALPDGLTGLPAPLDKPRRPEPVNAWLCRGVSCLAPISDLVNLKQALKENP